jgi:hypothetical protein
MARYCDPGTLVGTAHVPLPSAGRIVADGDAFRFAFDDMGLVRLVALALLGHRQIPPNMIRAPPEQFFQNEAKGGIWT